MACSQTNRPGEPTLGRPNWAPQSTKAASCGRRAPAALATVQEQRANCDRTQTRNRQVVDTEQRVMVVFGQKRQKRGAHPPSCSGRRGASTNTRRPRWRVLARVASLGIAPGANTWNRQQSVAAVRVATVVIHILFKRGRGGSVGKLRGTHRVRFAGGQGTEDNKQGKTPYHYEKTTIRCGPISN